MRRNSKVNSGARHFTFRYRLGQHFLEIFRTYHGPIPKAFEAPEEAGRKALARDILDLIGRFSTSGDETRFFRADICKLSAPSD